jgi:uroporphyrinogen-III decarboxylase
MGPRPLLLGNLDPVRVLRNGTPDMIRAAVADCHRQGGSRYIIGAGCEVPRDTPPDNARALLEYAKTAR